MSKDFYEILGISKTASESEIKKAFYSEAQKYHPDKQNGDDKKFKEINEAYQTLSNKEKRSQYDRFGSSGPNSGFGGGGAHGFEGFDFGGASNGGFHFDFGGANGIDLEDLLGGFGFGGFGPRPGNDIGVNVTLTFLEAISGTKKEIPLPKNSSAGGKEYSFSIPAGVEHGQRLKIENLGEVSQKGGRNGDLFLLVNIPNWPKNIRKHGVDLVAEVKIPILKALLGTTVQVSLGFEEIEVVIPELTAHESLVRVHGKGIRSGNRGSLIVVVNHEIPKKLSKEQKELLKKVSELS
jgi:DnaJ-class molecular chaperone